MTEPLAERSQAGVTNWFLRVRLHIHAGWSDFSSDDRWLMFEVKLPFVPFPGLEIIDPRLDGEIVCQLVAWYTDTAWFVTTLEDKTLYQDHARAQRAGELDKIVNQYLEAGWQRDPERDWNSV